MPEVHATRANGSKPNGPGWSIRTVTNKFAALGRNGTSKLNGSDLFKEVPGEGAHEVLIESPTHDARYAEFSEKKLQAVLMAYRARLIELMADPPIQYVQVIRNCGAEAGASLMHPHTQILGMHFNPDWIRLEVENAGRHFEAHGRCLFCDIREQESDERARVIDENESFIACTAFAPCFPYQSWILPKRHQHDYRLASDEELFELAVVMKRTMMGIERALEAPPFNLTLYTAPKSEESLGGASRLDQVYHWRFEITPRLTRLSAFELGAEVFINPISPEKAALEIRGLTNGNGTPMRTVDV